MTDYGYFLSRFDDIWASQNADASEQAAALLRSYNVPINMLVILYMSWKRPLPEHLFQIMEVVYGLDPQAWTLTLSNDAFKTYHLLFTYWTACIDTHRVHLSWSQERFLTLISLHPRHTCVHWDTIVEWVGHMKNTQELSYQERFKLLTDSFPEALQKMTTDEHGFYKELNDYDLAVTNSPVVTAYRGENRDELFREVIEFLYPRYLTHKHIVSNIDNIKTFVTDYDHPFWSTTPGSDPRIKYLRQFC